MINTESISNATERELVNLMYDLQDGFIDEDEFTKACLELAEQVENDYK